MATSLGRLVLDMAANAAGFERDMQRISKSAKKELTAVNRQLRFAERDLDQARGKVNRLAGAMGALGAVAIAGVGREFRKFAQEANALDKVSQTVSLTVEELQELRFAAEQAAGVSANTLDMAMQRFSRRVGEAANDTGELNTVVKELGVQLRNADGSVKSQTELLQVFANEIKNAGSEQEQLRIAFKLFDSEGAKMVTLMRQGGDALQEYVEQARRAGGVMSGETVEATVRFNDALNILSENIKGLRNQFFGGLIGPLSEFAEWLATTEEGQRLFNESLVEIGKTAKTLGAVIGGIFVARLAAATAAMVAAEIRVARLTAAQLGLRGATITTTTAVTVFGRAVSVMTGPIGIAIGVLGTLYLGYQSVKEAAETAGVSMDDFGRGAETTAEKVARLTGNMEELNRIQRRNAFMEMREEALELRRSIIEIDREIEQVRQGQEESGFLDPALIELQAARESMMGELNLLIDGLNDLNEAGEQSGGGVKKAGDEAGGAANQFDTLLDRVTAANKSIQAGIALPQEYAQAMQSLAGSLVQAATGLQIFNDEAGQQSGDGIFPDFGVLDTALEALEDMNAEMQEMAALEWDFENIADSFHPLSQMMRQLGDQIAVIDENLNRGLITEAQAGMSKVGASANAAFSAMMAGVDQTSSEYKKLERAQQITNVALGIAAILQQGMGDPYTAIPRMIAMAAMVASLGVDAGGISGGSASQRRQDTQGTGTVLGDSEAKSESISNAVETTADATSKLVGIQRGMAHSIEQLQQGLTGAAGMVARGASDVDIPNLNLGSSDWGFTSTKLADEGIALLGGAIAEMTEGAVAQAFNETRKSNLFSTSYKKHFGELDDAFNDQLNLIFGSMIDTVTEAGQALGIPLDDIQSRIEAFEVAALEISLKDLDAEEQQAELSAVFSRIFDDFAAAVIPFAGQFQQIGEGMGETLVRVATSVQVAEEAVHRLGLNISDNLGPERMAQVSVGLVEAAGGIESFISDMENFMSTFAPEAHQFAVAQSDITRALEQMNMELPESREGFWQLIQTIDGTTEAGQRQIATLLGLADAADTYYSAVEEIEQEREGLERRLMELNGQTAAIRELELEALDESNRALQKRIWALEDEAKLADLMSGVGEDIASLVMSSERLSFHRINQEFRETYEQAQRLGASERELNLIRWRHTLQMRQMASELEASIVSMLEEFQGVDSSFESVGSSAASAASSMQGLADSIRDTIISIQGSDTGTLNPVGQRDFLQEQFDIAMAAGDFGQANQIASQLAQSIRRVGASGEDADARIEQLLADLAEMEDQARQAEPPTSAQVSGIASSASSIEQDAMRQIELASQMIDKIGLLAAISGEAPLEIAERLGVPMEELIGTMLDVEQFGVDQVSQLGAIADQLGVGLDDLGAVIGVNIGTLDDSMSLLNTAFRETLGDLPPEIADPLLEALDLVEDSGNTTELENLVDDLSPSIRDELTPFFDGIDPTNYMSDQLEEQKEITRWTMAGAQASEAMKGIMEKVRLNMQAQNDEIGIPSYQTGTSYVPQDGPAYLHRGEAVLTAQENRERGRSDDRATVAAIRDMQKQLAARMDAQEREMRRRNDLLEREERRRRTTI